jgi:hypothetical protein
MDVTPLDGMEINSGGEAYTLNLSKLVRLCQRMHQPMNVSAMHATSSSEPGVQLCLKAMKMSIHSKVCRCATSSSMVRLRYTVLRRTVGRCIETRYGSGVLIMTGYASCPGRLTIRCHLSRSNSSDAQTAPMRYVDLSISGGKVRTLPTSAILATQSLNGMK